MSGQRILVVDDEERFRQALVQSLLGHDYDVMESATAGAAISDCQAFNPDLVLLDLMLPDGDGLDVCAELRRDSEAAIIVLSVLGDEQIKVRALDNGADDYLTKPFGSEELLARIRAVMRRAGQGADEAKSFEVEALRIDFVDRLVFLEGEEVRLTPTEFSLLQFFAQNAGRILRHQAILRSVWGNEYSGDTQNLRTYINQLRAKLNDDPAHPRFIRTEPGIGYRFVLPNP